MKKQKLQGRKNQSRWNDHKRHNKAKGQRRKDWATERKFKTELAYNQHKDY